jgi:EmrB/QacA subfamily drug resistance transporter
LTRENPHHEKRWTILAFLGVAQLMIVLDVTVVNVALPSAQQALHFSNDQRQWIITAYALAFGSLLLLGGKISDAFGRKRTLVIGISGFVVASALGGLAQSFAMLAGARALQGAFAALLAPAVLSLLSTTFTVPAERNKAFGIYGAILGSGASIGLLLGGALTELLDWRAVMFVNVFIAAAALSGVLALLVNETPREKPSLDLAGTVTVSAGLFAVVFGLSHAETSSWGNPTTVALLAAGGALLAVFALIEARVAHPLLPLRVLADRTRAASFLSIGIAAAAMFGVFLFLTYYLQQLEGYSPIMTGLAFLPMTLVVMITATTASTKLRRRFGPGPLVATGMVLGAVAMLYLSRLGVSSTYATEILPALLLLGVALGLIFATATNNGTLGVEESDSGVASATLNASQQVGGSVGTALLSTVAASATTSYLTGLHATAAIVAGADVEGYTAAFRWSAGIFALGALVTAAVFGLRWPRRKALPAVRSSGAS